MNVQDLISIADRVEGIIRRARTFGKTRDEVLDELAFLAEDLNNVADRLADDMYQQYVADMEEAEKLVPGLSH